MKECVKTNKKKIVLAMVMATAGLGQFVLVESANATFPVIEVGPNQIWNLISQIENTLTAVQTLESYKQQIDDAINNFTKLGNLGEYLKGAGISEQQLDSYRFNITRLIGTAQDLSALQKSLQRQYAVSKTKSWAQFFADQQQAADNGDSLANMNIMRARKIQDELQGEYDQINKNQSAVNAITGTQSGFQAVASQLQLVTRQNAQMLELLSAKQTKDNIKGKTESMIQKENTRQAMKDMMDAQQKANDNLRSLRSMDPGLADAFNK